MAEQYLIRAEAKAQLGDLNGSLVDLNIIRHRAGLDDFSSAVKDDIVGAILKERRIELFTEWGHRWLDIKRSPQMNATMSTSAEHKGGAWQDTDRFYPIPFDDILKNPNLT